jgi:hypothetical protein
LYCLRTTIANGQTGTEILSSTVQISTAAMTVSQSVVADSLPTPTRAPISALDQAMAATLAAITVPSPQTGM